MAVMRRGTLRALVPALVAVVALALAGCGDSAGDGSGSAGNGKDKYTIGYDAYWLGNSWSVQLQAEFKAAVARHSADVADVVYTQSDNNAQKQISNVQSMIARKVDAILLTPISPTAIAPVIKQADAAKIPVILVGSPAQSDDYTSLVNVDDVAFGRQGAQWLADKLAGKGNIYVLNGLAGIPTSEQRWQGAKEVFDKYPGITVLSTANADWDQAKAKTVVADMLAAKSDVNGIWSQGGSMTLGAIQAFQAAGHPLVPMTGEDSNGLLKEWSKLKAQGSTGFDSIAVCKPTWLSAQALDTTLKVLKGESVTKDDIIPPPTITSDSLARYVRDDLPDSFWSNTKMSDDQIRQLFKQ
jgi:ribose transport system substrate-binding protein